MRRRGASRGSARGRSCPGRGPGPRRSRANGRLFTRRVYVRASVYPAVPMAASDLRPCRRPIPAARHRPRALRQKAKPCREASPDAERRWRRGSPQADATVELCSGPEYGGSRQVTRTPGAPVRTVRDGIHRRRRAASGLLPTLHRTTGGQRGRPPRRCSAPPLARRAVVAMNGRVRAAAHAPGDARGRLRQPLLGPPKPASSSSPSSSSSRPAPWRRRMTADASLSRADLVLLLCYVVTGLLDSASTQVWGAFVSMQTGAGVAALPPPRGAARLTHRAARKHRLRRPGPRLARLLARHAPPVPLRRLPPRLLRRLLPLRPLPPPRLTPPPLGPLRLLRRPGGPDRRRRPRRRPRPARER